MWNQERDAELNAFLDTDPRLSDFEEKFHFYQEWEERFLSEPDCIVIGPVAIYTGKVESTLWTIKSGSTFVIITLENLDRFL